MKRSAIGWVIALVVIAVVALWWYNKKKEEEEKKKKEGKQASPELPSSPHPEPGPGPGWRHQPYTVIVVPLKETKKDATVISRTGTGGPQVVEGSSGVIGPARPLTQLRVAFPPPPSLPVLPRPPERARGAGDTLLVQWIPTRTGEYTLAIPARGGRVIL